MEFSGGVNLRGFLSVGCNADGRLEVFVVRDATGPDRTDYDAYHKWQTQPNEGWNQDWASLNATQIVDIGGSLAIDNNSDGRLELFLIGRNHDLHHTWQTAPNGGWSDWARQ